MSSDKKKKNDSPVEGKGEEMVPERGMPFEEEPPSEENADEVAEEAVEGGAPRDLTPEEMAELLGSGAETISAAAEAGEEVPRDSGLGAVYPVLTDEELSPEAGLPETEVALPTDESVRGMPVFGAPHVLDAEALAELEEREASAHLDSTEDMLRLFITRRRLLTLWERIDRVQEEIRDKIPSLPIARSLLDQVERARNELMAGKDYYEEAERALNEAELRIAITSRAIAEGSHANKLLAYELAWALVLVISYVFIGPFLRDAILSSVGPDALQAFPTLASDVLIGVNTALAGAFGGIVNALYALWKHVSRDVDYSKQYALWYITNPVLGLFLGFFIYLFVRAGMISLTLSAQEISFPPLIYLLALAVGFQQNVAYSLIRRLLQSVQLGQGEEGSASQSAAGENGS